MGRRLWTLLLLLWASGAHGGRLHQCEAILTGPSGEIRFPAWGHSESVATQRAVEVAWIAALADAWPAAAAGALATPEDWRLRRSAQLDQHDAAGPWLVPGYRVTTGGCTNTVQPPVREDAWKAIWQREERPALRNDPAVAIEAARRRSCFGAWQNRMMRAAQAGAAATSERYAAVFTSARASTDTLLACLGRDASGLELAGAPLPSVEDRGTVQCLRPRHIGGEWTGSVAWSSTPEDAREAAMRADLMVQLRRADAELDRVAAALDPAERADRLLAGSMRYLGGLVVATDLAEQALMNCSAAEPVTVRIDWTEPVPGACESWPSRETDAMVALADQLTSAHQELCASGYRAGALEDWSRADRCDAACRSRVSVDGWRGTAIWREGEPRRGTAEEAERSLGQALGTRDWHLLGVVTGGVTFEPGYAVQFKSDPTAFWRGIEQARASGRWADVAQWHFLGGAWVLGFKQ